MAKKTAQKSSHIHIRSDESLKKLISLAAKKAGIQESSWIRQRLEAVAKRELGK